MEWQAGLFLLGVIFVTMALFSWGRARKKQGGTNVTAREHLERARQKQAVRDDMQDLMVEIEQLAKRLGAQLDAKTVHIEKTIREADERIARLEALGGAADAADAGGGSAEGVAVEPQVSHAKPQAGGDGLAGMDAFVGSATADESASAGEPYADPLTLQVYALADAGRGPQAIAQELHEQVGKVELILALRSA